MTSDLRHGRHLMTRIRHRNSHRQKGGHGNFFKARRLFRVMEWGFNDADSVSWKLFQSTTSIPRHGMGFQ
ncbi:unnamed protein product [Prunus armeniaca]|uniref:Uncharacterized protein n=1 Tax=Prunus armeniaca TaxID=36596 RepID=A0A6J5VXP0_PRUAR|nr:unnamed protein product [Prunus armeniaca]